MPNQTIQIVMVVPCNGSGEDGIIKLLRTGMDDNGRAVKPITIKRSVGPQELLNESAALWEWFQAIADHHNPE